MLLGFHVSIAGSIDKSVDRAFENKFTTFQIFTRNPRGWMFSDINKQEVSRFIKKCNEHKYKYPIAHMPYLPNLASSNEENYNKSISTLISEMNRCNILKIPYLVTHLGSHLGKGESIGLKRVINACNIALIESDNNVILLLENTAGTKNSIGSKFENIKFILDNIENNKRIGVCFDTAHAFAAGYDLRSSEDVEITLNLLDNIIGFDKVKTIHLNDSKSAFNSHSDRHEHIGLGYIGEEGFRSLLKHKIVKESPLILETPVDSKRGDLENLKKVIELVEQ